MKKLTILLITILFLSGCSTVISEKSASNKTVSDYEMSFKESELDSSYKINGSTYISLGNEDINIKKGGTYILEGTLSGSVIVEVSEKEDVQLVLNNVTINAGDFAGIYIVEGDEITITLAEGSTNTISDSAVYTQIDDNGVDSLIYSKADLIINGTGTLNLSSKYNHGIVSKDDLIITGGTYNVDVAGQGLRGKDCVKISSGNFNIISGKDAIKSDNNEDEYRGYVYIEGGNFVIDSSADGIYGYSLVDIEDGDFRINTSSSTDADSYKGIKSDKLITINGGTFELNTVDDSIHTDGNVNITSGKFNVNCSDDAIHADGKISIEDGEFSLICHEGLEATYILINGGNIYIEAQDDGINAGQKVADYTPTVEINGGDLKIIMAQGDTDAIDSNGYIYINGGNINITAQSGFDFDLGAEHNGGTIIVNGSEVDQITSQMGMGGNGMGNMPGMGFNNEEFKDGANAPSEFPGMHHR